MAIIEGGPILVRAVIIDGERIELLRGREARAVPVLFAGDDGVAGREGGDKVRSAIRLD